MADVLAVDREDFVAQWCDPVATDRCMRGDIPSAAERILECCCLLGSEPTPDAVDSAVQVYFDHGWKNLVPREGVMDTLSHLKAGGYRLGLMSDCSWETPALWPRTPFAPLFDSALFSCTSGVRKPDPRFYMMTCDRLQVEPHSCLYVGDSVTELEGAIGLGMSPVLMCAPQDREAMMRYEKVRNWRGPVIQHLPELLTFLEP
jgi:putative hydrolase of the HAD superfamily